MPRGKHAPPSKARAVAALVAAIVGSAVKVKPAATPQNEGGS
jgi:hypothetical protein